jgi:hypothetical protein
MSVKDRVEEKLQNGGSISSSDIGSFATEADAKEEEKVDPLTTTDIADVPEKAKEDIVMGAAEALNSNDVLLAAMHDNPAGVLFEQGKVELTPEDKTAFLSAIVSDERFELPFSLFDGKIEGVFRSRLNKETRAILQELRRQLTAEEFNSEIEYTTRMRHAIMRFQLKEINGESYPLPTELTAIVSVPEGSDEKVVTPPQWTTEAEVYFNGNEARTAAIYNALCIFEGKYWTLVENANNQDFWQTEDSTSE